MEPVATGDVFEADPGGFPRSRSEPRSRKSYEAPDDFPAPGLLHQPGRHPFLLYCVF